jgi:putative nucleotidyltransferase with HDIG domain
MPRSLVRATPPLKEEHVAADFFSGVAAASTHERTRALQRSLTLLRVFLVASAAILLAGAVILSSVLSSRLKGQVIDDARSSLTQYVDGVLRPQLVERNAVDVHPQLSRLLIDELRRRPEIVTVKVWRSSGVLAWTNRARGRIGHRFEIDGNLGTALRKNESVAEIEVPDREENAVERSLGFGRLLEVYAPIEDARNRHAIGAYEIYADPKRSEHLITANKHAIWAAVTLVFLALYAALAVLVRTASRTLRRQATSLAARTAELSEAYAVLEQDALEAVETLNATVDARDPYTAGHSHRVQEIALSLARELGIEGLELDAIRYAGLFHDIGKLGVPDAILTKPAKLTAQEYELMKQHPADGAKIVAKFGRLRDAVPLIRHHHERWDGQGYPDRLAAESIPLGAAIVGLADAWDAMTTDRPYHRALDADEAEAELRRHRGTQFAPAVVDAFFRVFERSGAVERDTAEATETLRVVTRTA